MKLKELTKTTQPNAIVHLVEPKGTYLGAAKASSIGHGTEYKNVAEDMESQTIPCLDNRNVENWYAAKYNAIFVYLKANKEAK